MKLVCLLAATWLLVASASAAQFRDTMHIPMGDPKVYAEKIRERIRRQSTACDRADIVIALDGSGSIVGRDPAGWSKQQKFTQDLVEAFDVGPTQVRIGLMTFSTEGIIRHQLDDTQTKDAIKAKINNLPHTKSFTNTPGAIDVMKNDAFAKARAGVARIGIVVTDGVPNRQNEEYDHVRDMVAATNASAASARASGITMFAVGIGLIGATKVVYRDFGNQTLNGIASSPRNVFQINSFDDFEDIRPALESQVKSSCAAPTTCEAADIVIALDASGSIEGRDPQGWAKQLSFTRDLVDTFDIGPTKIRIGVITFSDAGTIHYQLDDTQTKDALKSKISGLVHTKSFTNTPDGIDKIVLAFTKPRADGATVAKIGIVVTDGVPNQQNEEVDHVQIMVGRTNTSAATARNSGILMFAVGIGLSTKQVYKKFGEETLAGIASGPNFIFRIDSFDDFNKIKAELEKRVKGACAQVTTVAPVTSGPVCNVADLAFVIDSSGSVVGNDPQGWAKSLSFAINVVNEFEVGQDRVRVAVITFSERVGAKIYLNKYSTRTQVTDAIRGLVHQDGTTNTPEALQVLNDEIFLPANGDRANAPNIAVVITDGVPNLQAEEDGHVATMVQATKVQADKLKNRNPPVTMFSIGVGLSTTKPIVVKYGMQTLKIIASSDQNVFSINNFDALETIKAKVKQAVSTACLSTIATTPSTTTKIDEPDQECREPTDVYFVLDVSGSIGSARFAKMKEFVNNIVEKLNVASDKTRVGMITFSTDPTMRWDLNQYRVKADLKNAVSGLSYNGGRTETWEALQMLYQTGFTSGRGDRSFRKNIAIVITDGGSQNTAQTVAEAISARQRGITIYAVGVGGWTNRDELRRMASDPDANNLKEVANFNSLGSIVDATKDAICNTRNECTANGNPCQNGGTCVDLINDYYCICPSGRVGKNCDRQCREAADIVFAIDSSGSIGWQRFLLLTQYVKGVILNLNIAGGTRVGIETFSDNAQVRFHLNKYNNKADIYNATDFTWNGGTTNTAAALTTMHGSMFTSANGDRANIRNVGVMITDGQSNNYQATLAAAARARNEKGIEMIVVAVKTDGFLYSELWGMASDPNEKNLIRIVNFDDVASQANINQLSEYVCNNVNECASNPCQNSGVCTDYINKYMCRCASGTTGRNCEKRCDGKLDLIFVLDTSGSVHPERFHDKVKPTVKYIIDNLEVASDRARVGVITFGDSSVNRFYLNTYDNKEDVLQAVDMLEFSGGRTNTQSALNRLRVEGFTSGRGDRSDVQNMAIVVTDGWSNIQAENTLPEAIKAKLAGIHVVTVAVSMSSSRMLEIKGIASAPSSVNVFNVDRWNNLLNFNARLEKSICNDVNECNSNPCQGGGRCIDGYSSYVCVCSGERTGANCERRCNKQYDVTFVIDRSGSVESTFEQQMVFVRTVIQGLSWQFDRTRVAVVLYDNNAKVDFRLNTYNNQISALTAINYVQVSGGRTNTADGIRAMRQQVFGQSGDRGGVTNIGIVVTDGFSNINTGSTFSEAQSARNSGISLYAVGIGNSVNVQELNGIATDPDSTHVYTGNNGATIAANFLTNICS